MLGRNEKGAGPAGPTPSKAEGRGADRPFLRLSPFPLRLPLAAPARAEGQPAGAERPPSGTGGVVGAVDADGDVGLRLNHGDHDLVTALEVAEGGGATDDGVPVDLVGGRPAPVLV